MVFKISEKDMLKNFAEKHMLKVFVPYDDDEEILLIGKQYVLKFLKSVEGVIVAYIRIVEADGLHMHQYNKFGDYIFYKFKEDIRSRKFRGEVPETSWQLEVFFLVA